MSDCHPLSQQYDGVPNAALHRDGDRFSIDCLCAQVWRQHSRARIGALLDSVSAELGMSRVSMGVSEEAIGGVEGRRVIAVQ